jgi:Peduoviridae DNA polymerase exonuclease subunit
MFCRTISSDTKKQMIDLESDLVILDTETTGLDERAEIVELSIIDKHGNTLFDSLIKPKGRIPHEAEQIHGISNADVKNAKSWLAVYDDVRNILEDRSVAIYNAEYDTRIIQQTCKFHDLDMIKFNPVCVMLYYAKYWGEWNYSRGNYKWQKLTNAAKQQGIEIKNAHRALGDCIMTLAVLNKMVEKE